MMKQQRNRKQKKDITGGNKTNRKDTGQNTIQGDGLTQIGKIKIARSKKTRLQARQGGGEGGKGSKHMNHAVIPHTPLPLNIS